MSTITKKQFMDYIETLDIEYIAVERIAQAPNSFDIPVTTTGASYVAKQPIMETQFKENKIVLNIEIFQNLREAGK